MEARSLGSIFMLGLLSVAGYVDAAPPSCSDPQVLTSLAEQMKAGDLTWKAEDILTLDWDAQTADLAGINPVKDITRLNSCAAVMVPSKDKVWVPGQQLHPNAQKNMRSNQRTVDAMCSGNRRGRPSDPNAATSPLCKRLQESQQRQQDHNKGVEDGGWADVEPRKIRYLTGRFDDGRVFARVILR